LGVKYDAKLINQVMQEERGAALRLLYQLKLGLERSYGEPQLSTTGLNVETVLKKYN
jgi:hypothetical protein